MKARRSVGTALLVLGTLVMSSLGCAHGTHGEPAREPQPAPATTANAAPVELREAAEAKTEQAEPTSEPKPTTRVVRRIQGSEMTVPVVKMARQIIDEHYKKPFGYEVEFEIEGKRYLGRIEPHYHPPGGELRPWGHHAGCSLYVVEQV